jgi:hypothetical protein
VSARRPPCHLTFPPVALRRAAGPRGPHARLPARSVAARARRRASRACADAAEQSGLFS